MSFLNHNIDSAFKRLEGAYAPNTLKSYYADVSHFVDWCGAKSVQAFPLDDGVLVEFIEAHQFTLRSGASSRRSGGSTA